MAIIEKDGYLVDDETGEVQGLAETPGFKVTDLSGAEWVLEKMAQEDAGILALTARRNALTANLDAMIREHQNRREWLGMRFGHELESFAEGELAGKKTRTLPTAFGKLYFRRIPGSIIVIDKDAALAWASAEAPDAVQIETRLLVSALKGREETLPAAFEVLPPADRFYIETGVKADSKKGTN